MRTNPLFSLADYDLEVMGEFEAAYRIDGSGSQRIAWIDNAKTIAIVLMVADHTLIYFGNETHWSRLSVTRLAEPLFAMSLFYVLSTRGRGITVNRWLQLAGAAAVETFIHSHREGHLYFGILTCVAIVVPITILVQRGRPGIACAIVVASSFLSLVAIEPGGMHIDYGPMLLIGQIPIAAHLDRPRIWISLVLASIGSSFGAIFALTGLGVALTANIWTLLIGQPLAVVLLFFLQRHRRGFCKFTGIARYPLSIYLLHLVVLQISARALEPRAMNEADNRAETRTHSVDDSDNA